MPSPETWFVRRTVPLCFLPCQILPHSSYLAPSNTKLVCLTTNIFFFYTKSSPSFTFSTKPLVNAPNQEPLFISAAPPLTATKTPRRRIVFGKSFELSLFDIACILHLYNTLRSFFSSKRFDIERWCINDFGCACHDITISLLSWYYR